MTDGLSATAPRDEVQARMIALEQGSAQANEKLEWVGMTVTSGALGGTTRNEKCIIESKPINNLAVLVEETGNSSETGPEPWQRLCNT